MKSRRRPYSSVNAQCYDRFIPRRYNEMCSVLCDSDESSKEERDILTQDARESLKQSYRDGLRAALNLPLSSSRCLFRGISTIRGNFLNSWPVKQRKKPIITTPDCALDLPEFKAMYYFNLLDWGSTGFLAAALNLSVFLCHPDTNKTVHLTDIDDPQLASRGGEYGTAVKWDVSGIKLVIGTNRSNIQIWDTVKRKLLGEAWCSCAYLQRCSINSLIWSSCSTYLVSGCSSGKLSIILSADKRTGEYISAHDGNIVTLSCSPDGKYLASSGSDNVVRVWTWPQLLPYFEIIYDYPVKAMVWHPWKPSLLAIGGGVKCGTITIYNINNCTKVAASDPKRKCVVLSLAWSNCTGELVASFWVTEGVDVSNGHSEILVLSDLNRVTDKFMVGYPTQVMYLMWSPNGEKVATASTDETLRIWNFVPTDMKKSAGDKMQRKSLILEYEANLNTSFSKYILR